MIYIGIAITVVLACLMAGFIDAALEQRKRDKENKTKGG